MPRALRRSPGLTLVSAVTMEVGIGVSNIDDWRRNGAFLRVAGVIAIAVEVAAKLRGARAQHGVERRNVGEQIVTPSGDGHRSSS